MEKNHLSLIFYFLINIVIFTSTSSVDDLFSQLESDADAVGELSSSNNDADLLQSGMDFNEIIESLNRVKSRRESPYDREPKIIRNAVEKALGDKNIRDIGNHISLEVGAKAAAKSKPTNDTSNGKLIHVLFIGVSRCCFTPVHAEIPFHFVSPLHVHLPNRQFIVLF